MNISIATPKAELVDSIMREVGPMRRPDAHRRFLRSLHEQSLRDRLAQIRREKSRPARW